MLTLITCPTCHHKFTVPESSMGQRRTCPNCEAIFVAGKSVAEGNRLNGEPRRGLLERAGAEAPLAKAPIDRTMLGEVAAMVRYNCPRCKKPLESPASEAGTKKPCPECGGRLQVPAAPAPAAPAFDPMNKTLLASAEPSAPPLTYAPSPAAPAPAAIAAPERSASPWGKIVLGAAVVAVLVVGALYFVGKHNAEQEYQKLLLAQKNELDALKAEIAQKNAAFQQQQQLEAQQRRAWEEQKAKQEARQKELDREREAEMRRLATLNDEKQAADARAKLEQKQRELEDERRAANDQRLRSERETREQLEALRKQLDQANQRTTIIQQPPPFISPWWPGRYYPW